MRTPIIYINPRTGWLENLNRILKAREEAFPREKVARHRIAWVRASQTGGYWTTP